jgi:hypothetical protein
MFRAAELPNDVSRAKILGSGTQQNAAQFFPAAFCSPDAAQHAAFRGVVRC